VDGVVVAGVVRNAATGDEWTATLGGGAWRDGRRLTGSVRTTLDQTLLATGFGYDPARRAHQGAVLAGVITRVRDIRRFGAAALDLCMAAEGTVDAYFEKGLNPWDHAPGGTSGSPSSTSDWFTSVLVASCWYSAPITMSTTSVVRLAMYCGLALPRKYALSSWALPTALGP
jgi:hypothetical protein